MDAATTARIHLLPAKEAPYVVIILRKPSGNFHIIRWDIERDEFEHGSWFKGHIYAHCSDVSFDGKWMVYCARGPAWDGPTWSGVCLLPYLKTYLETDAQRTGGAGGYWRDSQTLITCSWGRTKGAVPFRVEDVPGEVLAQRMKRDGWIHNENKKSWIWQFHHRGPTLEAIYHKHMFDFEFRLQWFPCPLDKEVEWATFAANGDLVFARLGWVYRCSRKDLRKRKPGFAADLNGLTSEMTRLGK
jgi:hypothetical protein